MSSDLLESPHIGRLIAAPVYRREWRDFVLGLHEAALPGGPLDGWVFHGAAAATCGKIAREGMRATHAVVNSERSPDRWREVKGCHFGKPAVAAFFAEDRIESTDDPDLRLGILAVRLEDLSDLGRIAADGQMLDCPLTSRLGRSEEEIYALWDASAKGWRDCLDIYGAVVVLSGVPADRMTVLTCRADVAQLVGNVEFVQPSPGR